MRLATVVLPALVLALACAAKDDAPTSEGDTSAPTDGGPSDSGTTDPTATSESAGMTATDAGSSDSGSDGTGATTGLAFQCVDDSDCRLLDDCCACEALHVDDEVPPSCDLACDRTLCQLWGTDVFCSHTCVLRLVDCDPALIDCTDEPPVCDDGFQPAIVERCWTQQCVPVELCTPY